MWSSRVSAFPPILFSLFCSQAHCSPVKQTFGCEGPYSDSSRFCPKAGDLLQTDKSSTFASLYISSAFPLLQEKILKSCFTSLQLLYLQLDFLNKIFLAFDPYEKSSSNALLTFMPLFSLQCFITPEPSLQKWFWLPRFSIESKSLNLYFDQPTRSVHCYIQTSRKSYSTWLHSHPKTKYYMRILSQECILTNSKK